MTLLSIGMTGCHTYYPYGVGGGYPGSYSMPPAGGTVIPPNGGAYMSPGVQGYQPQAQIYGSPTPVPYGQPTPQPNQTYQGTPQQGTGSGSGSYGDAPTYNPERDGVAEPQDDNFVPDYREPDEFEDPIPQQDSFDDETDSPFGYNSVPGASPAIQLPGIEETSANDPDFAGAPDDQEPFLSPIPVESASAGGEIQPVQFEQEAQRPNPYDFDRENFGWLRGIVDFDEEEQAWHIIYNLTPDDSDPFGGDITLEDDPRLSVLKPSDIVLVEGNVDPNSRDSFGKPRYKVDNLSRLVPKNQQ